MRNIVITRNYSIRIGFHIFDVWNGDEREKGWANLYRKFKT